MDPDERGGRPLSPAGQLNGADLAWMMTSTALVLLMTPALGFFYGGMVGTKSVLNTILMSFTTLGYTLVAWALLAYSLAFSPGNAIIGDLRWAFLRGIDLAGSQPLGPTISHVVYMAFQATFAIITVALISGGIVSRMRIKGYLLFITLWVICIYGPIAHWVWGGGWLGAMGALDYAGGSVVHLNAGTAGLVTCLVLGKRVGLGSENMAPHNLVLSVIGASLLWVGWFGFNA